MNYLDSRSSKRSESGAGLFPSLWVNLVDDFLLLLRPRDLVTALRMEILVNRDYWVWVILLFSMPSYLD